MDSGGPSGTTPFWEWARRLTSAELVVRPHGAGLAFIDFGKDMTLLELFGC